MFQRSGALDREVMKQPENEGSHYPTDPHKQEKSWQSTDTAVSY
jgi:hypothetical protein